MPLPRVYRHFPSRRSVTRPNKSADWCLSQYKRADRFSIPFEQRCYQRTSSHLSPDVPGSRSLYARAYTMHHGSFRSRHRMCRSSRGRPIGIRHCFPSSLVATVRDALHPRLRPTSGRSLQSRPFRRRQIINISSRNISTTLGEHTTDAQAPPGNFSASLSQAIGRPSAHPRHTTRQASLFYGPSTLLSIKTLSHLSGLQDHLVVHS